MIQHKEKNSLQNWELVSVNPNEKNWGWKDLFCFWGNSIQSVIGFSLVASLYLLYDLNILIVFIGTLISGVLSFLKTIAAYKIKIKARSPTGTIISIIFKSY